MNSSPTPSSSVAHSSLYELAISAEPSFAVLQISPTTLKSLVDSLLQRLIEERIPATLWVKFPKGEVWQADLVQYCQLLDVPKQVYLFQTGKEEDSSESLGDEGLGAIAPSETLPVVQTIALAPDSPLKREYLLAVVSPQFCGLIVAHRSHTLRSSPIKDFPLTAVGGSSDGADSEPKQVLLTLCSFNLSTVERVLDGLKQAVLAARKSGMAEQVVMDNDQATATPDDQRLFEQWDRACQTYRDGLKGDGQGKLADLTLLGHWFCRQVQQQEDTWRRMTTYRKQAETVETLQLQNAELLNTLRLKDEFLQTAAQELRTPLTNMKTALSLLNSPTLKLPQRQRYMDLLNTECDRQSSLITSLLNLIQLEQADDHTAQPLRLADIVPGVVSTYQPLAQEKGVRLAYTVPEDLPAISCVHNWLKQIVINLLHNGIKFTPRGGQVRVMAKQQGDFVQLDFQDTGIGITSSEIPKIFDRFYRVRHTGAEDNSGAGLGLTIVQQLLLRCGGSVSVRSRGGEGSTFTVLLPIYSPPGDGG